MHAVMLENLEEYLAGTLEPAELREIDAHLDRCCMCREELHAMQDVSGLFAILRTDEAATPEIPAGFTARVMAQVGGHKPVSVFASFFALNMEFGRRLVFASLLVLAVLGGYLVNHEVQYSAGPSPEAILAQQTMPSFDNGGADNMLATLTAYEH